MDAEFWHERWESNRIGFHESQPNPLLVDHFDRLKLAKGSRVFVPLCGKTLDIHWLLANGFKVAGAELSKLAVEQLFAELGREATVTPVGETTKYSATDIDVYVGDIFALTIELLGPVAAIYDRAALVALPATTREKYAAHLVQLTSKAPQLLITYEYNQSMVDGPPFSISCEEVQHHYKSSYTLTLLSTGEVSGGLKGNCPATEYVWLLNKR